MKYIMYLVGFFSIFTQATFAYQKVTPITIHNDTDYVLQIHWQPNKQGDTTFEAPVHVPPRSSQIATYRGSPGSHIFMGFDIVIDKHQSLGGCTYKFSTTPHSAKYSDMVFISSDSGSLSCPPTHWSIEAYAPLKFQTH